MYTSLEGATRTGSSPRARDQCRSPDKYSSGTPRSYQDANHRALGGTADTWSWAGGELITGRRPRSPVMAPGSAAERSSTLLRSRLPRLRPFDLSLPSGASPPSLSPRHVKDEKMMALARRYGVRPSKLAPREHYSVFNKGGLRTFPTAPMARDDHVDEVVFHHYHAEYHTELSASNKAEAFRDFRSLFDGAAGVPSWKLSIEG
eukprot:gnl/TRDRNA2_/TRDRNA2_189447_c0_seq1.p1 gnl/TRDRNA2_/TRDRNA2_189447_c0~~gnl/TRDRNA2_/TRDRNA2_189447_c0_seq1.p1  ORF type:complete len:204 (-),score=17.64 gnl/TRDRNA2_/TRDRNA2_189447_c0_seq1:25-636(-)